MKAGGYIVIEGIIGSGKTTLSHMLAKKFNAKLVLETFEDNPFLPKFYNDPERYAFSTELSFLANRFHQIKRELINYELFSPLVISDYHFLKSLLFAKMNLAEDEIQLYEKLFEIMFQQAPKPDLWVYLNITPDKALKNIAKRGREFEKNINEDYLQTLHNSYVLFFKQHKELNTMIVDTENTDFVQSTDDFQRICDAILNHMVASK